MTNAPKTPDIAADKPATAPVAPVKLPDTKTASDVKAGSNSHDTAKPLVTPAPQKS